METKCPLAEIRTLKDWLRELEIEEELIYGRHSKPRALIVFREDLSKDFGLDSE